MHLTLKAVIARNDGDVNKAIQYCRSVAAQYPQLADEYNALANELELVNDFEAGKVKFATTPQN